MQRDDMVDLQAAVMDDDALDDEPQDGLLVGKACGVQPAAYALANGREIVEYGVGIHLLAAELARCGKLVIEDSTLVGK